MSSRDEGGDTSTISQRVVEKVAAATDTDPCDLAPLYPAIDPDALNSLFDGAHFIESGTDGYVTFRMSGCEVVIWADGTVEVDAEEECATDAPTSGGASSAQAVRTGD